MKSLQTSEVLTLLSDLLTFLQLPSWAPQGNAPLGNAPLHLAAATLGMAFAFTILTKDKPIWPKGEQ